MYCGNRVTYAYQGRSMQRPDFAVMGYGSIEWPAGCRYWNRLNRAVRVRKRNPGLAARKARSLTVAVLFAPKRFQYPEDRILARGLTVHR